LTLGWPAPGRPPPSGGHAGYEVLALAVAGLSNRAIAGRLIVGEETVKSHLSSIYRKLEVSDRAGAVTVALREGIFH
jgi:DNA-binding NarL/FixJ family response regulator